MAKIDKPKPSKKETVEPAKMEQAQIDALKRQLSGQELKKQYKKAQKELGPKQGKVKKIWGDINEQHGLLPNIQENVSALQDALVDVKLVAAEEKEEGLFPRWHLMRYHPASKVFENLPKWHPTRKLVEKAIDISRPIGKPTGEYILDLKDREKASKAALKSLENSLAKAERKLSDCESKIRNLKTELRVAENDLRIHEDKMAIFELTLKS